MSPNSTLPQILFRVDSYDQIGLGHIKRCAALAQALKEKNIELAFVCKSEDAAIKTVLEPLGSLIINADSKINQDQDTASTIAAVQKYHPQSVVIDSYAVDKTYFQAFSDAGVKIAYFEDFGRTDWPVDIVINGLVDAEKIQYEAAETLLGTRNLVLGKEYWNARGSEKRQSDFIEIMITVGGIDHFDLTSRTLDLLATIGLSTMIHCVIGPYFENEAAITDAVERNPHKVQLHRQPASLAPLIKQCHLAVSAGGMTLYELAACGVATVGISLWENQRLNVQRLGNANIIAPLDYFEGSAFDQKLGREIRSLIDNPEKQNMQRLAGTALVDGLGARRVASALIQ
jgi:UDP-2,4-diacetamido-2,4,6-trideoxy-beta-L-altropyranose hydrolase